MRHQHDKMICHNHDHWSKNISSCDPSGNTTIHYFLNATTRTINTSLSRRKYIPMDQYVVILVQFGIVIHSRSWFPLPTDKTKSISLSSQQLKFIYCPAYSLHQEYARNALPFTRSAPPSWLRPAGRPRLRTAFVPLMISIIHLLTHQ